MLCRELQWMTSNANVPFVLRCYAQRGTPPKLSKLRMKTFGKPSRRILSSRTCMTKSWRWEKLLKILLPCSVLEDKVYRMVQLPHKTVYQVYIPSSLRQQLLRHYHADPSSRLVYWPKMSIDVRVRCCQICQLYKPETRKPPGKLQQTVVHGPWKMIGVDLMGPFPRSSHGNLYLLVFVDYYTRWVEMFPLRKATAESVSQILIREMLTRWGGSNLHSFRSRFPVCVICL